MHRIGRSGRAGEVGLGLSLIDYDDYHHFKVIEKKNKFKLDREQVEGFEVEDDQNEAYFMPMKPRAKPAGTGKKKKKRN